MSSSNPQDDVSEEVVEKVSLTEEELDAKLVEFHGVKNQLDEKTSKQIGKLLVAEADEAINANWESYKKLFEIMGGYQLIFFMVILQLFIHFWRLYEQSIQSEFADTDPDTQFEKHSEFLKKIFLVLSVGVIMRNTKDFWVRTKKTYMGYHIVNTTLKKVLEAPVNLFFDVTPIGKILQIFTEDMEVFRGHLIDPLNHCVNMMAHVVVVSTLLI